MKAIRTGKHNNPVRTARNPTRTAQNLAGAARNPTGNSTGSGREQHGMWAGKHAISLMRGTTAQRRRITTLLLRDNYINVSKSELDFDGSSGCLFHIVTNDTRLHFSLKVCRGRGRGDGWGEGKARRTLPNADRSTVLQIATQNFTTK